MSKVTDLLEEKITELKLELREAKKYTYVGSTSSLHCSDGELYIHYGDYPEKERTIVMDVEQLYKDLPFIIDQVCKEQKKMQEYHLNSIKETIKEL